LGSHLFQGYRLVPRTALVGLFLAVVVVLTKSFGRQSYFGNLLMSQRPVVSVSSAVRICPSILAVTAILANFRNLL
jgi:hypothetical protein